MSGNSVAVTMRCLSGCAGLQRVVDWLLWIENSLHNEIVGSVFNVQEVSIRYLVLKSITNFTGGLVENTLDLWNKDWFGQN